MTNPQSRITYKDFIQQMSDETLLIEVVQTEEICNRMKKPGTLDGQLQQLAAKYYLLACKSEMVVRTSTTQTARSHLPSNVIMLSERRVLLELRNS